MPKNFWIPSALGYTQATRGLCEEELAAIESRNTFPLPSAYRRLMQQQNGGTPRYSILQDMLIDDFICLSETNQDLVTFEDYLRLTCTQEEISAIAQPSGFFGSNRLIVFANSGHEVGCFDYGCRSKNIVNEPEVVFFSDDGNEFLHFKIIKTITDFNVFLSQLILPEDLNGKIHIGIESTLNFDGICSFLEERWETRFEQKTDDRYGWFNFEKWFYGSVPLYLDDQTLMAYAEEHNTTFQDILDWVSTEGRMRSIATILSPNQHRSGTYLYPDDPELTLVLEISKPWFTVERAIEQLCEQLSELSDIVAVTRLP
jgi:hypothetical protein